LKISNSRPYLLYVLLIFTPLARGGVQGWAITLIHILTLLAVTVFFIRAGLDGRLKWIKTPLDTPLLLLLLVIGAATVFSMDPGLSFWSSLLFLNYVAVFYLTIQAVRTRSGLRELLLVVIGVAFFLSVFGFIKTLGGNPFPWWDYTDLNQAGSFASTYGNRNHLAGYMEMAIPLLLGLYLTGLGGWKMLLAGYVTLVLIAALLLSLSRGGWSAAFIGLVFMGVCLLCDRRFKRKAFIVTGMVGVLVVTFLALSSTPVVERILTVSNAEGEPSLQSRVTVWGGVIEMMKERPLLGSGPGTFPYAYTKYQPAGLRLHFTMAHNDYLHAAAEVGIPLLAVALWMAVALYGRGLRKLGNASRLVRGTTLGALSGITAILVHSIFDFNLHIPANAILFAVLCAIVVAPVPEDNLGNR